MVRRLLFIVISIFFLQMGVSPQAFAEVLREQEAAAIDNTTEVTNDEEVALVGLPVGLPVGLIDAWQMGLKNHEAVSLAEEFSAQSRLDVSRAYSQVLPTLKADGNYTRYTEEKSSATGFSVQPEDSSRVEFRLYQPIYSGGRAMSTLAQAKKLRLSGELGLEDTRELVLIETARAYYTLLRSGNAVRISKASVRRLTEQVRVSTTRFKLGAVTRADLLRAEAELADRAADVVEAEGNLNNAEDLFRRITGLKENVKLLEEGEEALFSALALKVDFEIDEALELAFKGRRDYRRSVLGEGVARDGVKYAKGGFLPTVSIEGVHVMRGQTPETSFFLDEVTYGVVNVSVPIFEGGLRRADLSKARSFKRQAEIERISLKRNIELELRRAYNEMTTTKSRVDAYSKQFDFAKLNYDTVFKQYEHGLAGSTDLIDADTILASAEWNLTSAELAHKLSLLEVMRSLGILLNEVEGLLR